MRILICTGIYPPALGGPAQYAKNLKEALEKLGHEVRISTFKFERFLPSGFRHLYFFLKITKKMRWCDFCISLDTFSVGFPSVLSGKIFDKKVIIRTGGDFLWEEYTERTGKKILLKDFYQKEISNFSIKEKVIFNLTFWVLNNSQALIFSTDWQRKIWHASYKLDHLKIFLVENFYGEKMQNINPDKKVFIGGTRKLKWKNLDILEKSFAMAKEKDPDLILDMNNYTYENFMEEIKKCYAVVLVSLGDISPNMILDAIRFNKPFILTKETGLYEKLKDIGIFVDPLNKEEIKDNIIYLSKRDNYNKYLEKVKAFNFTHTWEQIAGEFIEIYKKI